MATCDGRESSCGDRVDDVRSAFDFWCQLSRDRARQTFTGFVFGAHAAVGCITDDGGASARSPDGAGHNPCTHNACYQHVAVPLTAPLFAYVFFDAALTLSPLALGQKLFAILAGSIFVAAAIRWIVGIQRLKAREAIDGLNILFMLVFVSAVMGTVAGSFLPVR